MEQTFLYLMEADGTTKIGISGNPQNRLLQLQTGNPTPIALRYTIPLPTLDIARKLETYLHKKYDHTRTHGEWFDVAPDTIYAEIQLTASILGSVASSMPTNVTKLQTLHIVKDHAPETTKGSETIVFNGQHIPHYWIAFDEDRAKPWVVGDAIELTMWKCRRSFHLVKTTDSYVVDMVNRDTTNSLTVAYGAGNVRTVRVAKYEPYTLIEHFAVVGRYNAFGEFLKAA